MYFLELKNVCRTFPSGSGTAHVLSDISFTVNRGEFLAVTGPSGCGKSTLLHLTGGLISPSSGDVLFNGVSLSHKTQDELARFRRTEAGIIYQFYNLVPELTARENLILPALMNHELPDESHVNEILNFLDLKDKQHLYPGQLSGGQQQKIAVGRALIHHPSMLLADEPTGNLDTAKRDELLELFRYLNRHEKMTILLVTHDPCAAQTAARCIRLLDGKVMRDTACTES